MSTQLNNEQLTIFYDGNCPMCSAEMQHLKRKDQNSLIRLVNLHQDGFANHYPDIDFDYAMKILHGTYQGNTLLGLEVTHRAWTLVGKGFWVAPLQWPIIKTIAHRFYLVLARNRHPVSAWLLRTFGIGGSAQCASGTCYDKSTNADHRRK
jgi:predicted DCC family thiol-disulfide oxidoreductase YuxK